MRKLELKNNRMHSASACRLISVLSGKGGVGKSVLTSNLADQISSLGNKVLIVDLDYNFGNQHILANIQASYGITQFENGSLSLGEAIYHVDDNLDLLPAYNCYGLFDQAEVTRLAEFTSRLREEASNYDVIICDHPSGLNKTTSVLAYASDIVLSVLVPELTSISDSYGLFKYLHEVDAKLDFRLLVNRAKDSDEAEYIVSKICALAERFIEDIPTYAGFVTENNQFKEAVASQTSIIKKHPDSPAVKELRVIARKLTGVKSGRISALAEINQGEKINKTPAFADIKG
ncbi:MAG: MinD/ParA family protein [Calditrichaeota bacterium]|nr:MAG: MinD/ParA family protein [Calditrichota bacterium]